MIGKRSGITVALKSAGVSPPPLAAPADRSELNRLGVVCGCRSTVPEIVLANSQE